MGDRVEVADLDADGEDEVLIAEPSIQRLTCLDASGAARWSISPPKGGRGPESLVIADTTGDGRPEVVADYQGGRVVAIDAAGHRTGTWSSARQLGAAVSDDIDADGEPEFLTATQTAAVSQSGSTTIGSPGLALAGLETDGAPI